MDKLTEIMKYQKLFGSKFCNFDWLSTPNNEPLHDKERKKKLDYWTKEFIVAAIDELMEAIRESNFKHWKQPREVDVLKMRFELIDVLHFLMSLMILWGMDSDMVYKMYMEKNAENFKRQKEGY